MELFFLSAKVPLTKTFTRAASGDIEKSPYPLVKNFTSHSETVTNADQFFAAVHKHAAQGHCLLKGRLHRALVEESRAGSTNALDQTEWLCFDLDNLKGVATVDAFVFTVLPKEFHDVSYILQFSASAGVSGDAGLRAHMFFMLDRPISPELIKTYVTSLNLDTESLRSQISLSSNGVALRYPLDRTVNQSDKLIYIAAPIVGPGVVDTMVDRIQLVQRAKSQLSIDWTAIKSTAQVDADALKLVTKLRHDAGLRKKEVKFRFLSGGDTLLTNPDAARVTGERKARGYVYLNINGGNSWGYYYPEGNPRYLYNFKGEPLVAIADFLPEYWAQIQKDLAGSWQGPRPFVFRNAVSDTLYAGVWDPLNERVENNGPHAISRTNLNDFFAQYELPIPNTIEDWDYEFDPTNPKSVDFAGKFCNQWAQTELMKMAKPGDEMPPTIARVINSVVGGDQECFNRFLNWLACIYQTRKKMMTAWVLHGVEGTGKGVLFKDVLMPIFGAKHCLSKQIASIEDRFNADLERCLIFNLDETRIEDSSAAKRTLNKLKHMITEQYQEVRGMRSNAYQARNYANFIFFSNDYDALAISATDRRFNVAPRQEIPISISENDIESIRNELLTFASYLAGYKTDIRLAQTALNNVAKTAMREASQDTVEQLCQAIADGNLEYFMAELDEAPGTDIVSWSQYQATIRRWLEAANVVSVAKRSDIANAYNYLIAPSNIAMGKKKFGRMLAHKNLLDGVHRCTVAKKAVRGYRVEWKATEEQLAEWALLLNPKKQPPQGSDSVATWTPSLSKSA